jgi:hypothetical protein
MKSRPWLLWALALIVTLASAVYQRMTGPTYPKRGKIMVGAEEVRFRFLRSYDGADDAEVRLEVPARDTNGILEFKRYRSRDQWSRVPLQREDRFLVGKIPHQPPAGKVMYRVYLAAQGTGEIPLTGEPVIIRFRGAVPPYILIPHIFLMFVGMLFSTRAGIEGLLRGEQTQHLAAMTALFLTMGGLILGPVVQKLAFGALWTGWPFGSDLTDNKTAAAFLFWIVAYWRLRKNRTAHGWAIAAAIIMLAVYAIPHSVLGSELDYSQG